MDPPLDIELSTVPDQLLASPEQGELLRADLRLTVTNLSAAPVWCSALTVVPRVGPGAPQLPLLAPGIVGWTSPATWTVVAPQEDVLLVVPQDGTAWHRRTEQASGPSSTDAPSGKSARSQHQYEQTVPWTPKLEK
ncbi:hypothetical protein ABTX81_05500 [Kitasatospora sp. NPDC097605]|uniref:hypothetical protein n=1 Tax=Kitasatospora sp. NPDC097605 TaxID=3157226 RepID=UPI0033253AAB